MSEATEQPTTPTRIARRLPRPFGRVTDRRDGAGKHQPRPRLANGEVTAPPPAGAPTAPYETELPSRWTGLIDFVLLNADKVQGEMNGAGPKLVATPRLASDVVTCASAASIDKCSIAGANEVVAGNGAASEAHGSQRISAGDGSLTKAVAPPRGRRGVAVDTTLITHALHQAILGNVEIEIDLLDRLDGDPDLDGCDDHQDCCPVEDVSTYGLVNVVTEDDELEGAVL